jgi:hypothetical protein
MRSQSLYCETSNAIALFETWLSFERVISVDDENGNQTIIWDIPDILLDLEKVTIGDLSWAFGLFLWHYAGISLERSRFYFDSADNEFNRIEYEFVLNFFVERYSRLVGTPNIRISVPKANMRTILPQHD